jgi:hypothetical protein
MLSLKLYEIICGEGHCSAILVQVGYASVAQWELNSAVIPRTTQVPGLAQAGQLH